MKLTFQGLASFSIFFIVNTHEIDPGRRYCFEFTWVQPDSLRNIYTCDNVTQDVCRTPIYNEPMSHSTFDSFWPNQSEYYIVVPVNQVCAKWVYYFNGIVEYITYFKTKVIEDNRTVITNGCYKQYIGSYVREFCACQSYPGVKPCNSAMKAELPTLLLMITSIFFNLLSCVS